jgi:hypothetical protein
MSPAGNISQTIRFLFRRIGKGRVVENDLQVTVCATDIAPGLVNLGHGSLAIPHGHIAHRNCRVSGDYYSRILRFTLAPTL